jgi:hypothetical protein
MKNAEKSIKATLPKAKVVELKTLSIDELFLFTLKNMGKPSLVRDMVANVKKAKIVTITKKKLLTKFYACASHLNRDGMIKRMPVNGSVYMYSLLGWKQLNTKNRLKMAA